MYNHTMTEVEALQHLSTVLQVQFYAL